MEGIELVEKVNHPGFRLHLDAGAMTLNQEDIYQVIESSMPYLNHFHISDPFLDKIGSNNVDHPTMAKALRQLGYSGWVSIEMKNGLSDNGNVQNVEAALKYATEIYGY